MSKSEVDREIYIQGLLAYIVDTPALTSLLYDINLLPEQTMDTDYYFKTLLVANAWKNNHESILDGAINAINSESVITNPRARKNAVQAIKALKHE